MAQSLTPLIERPGAADGFALARRGLAIMARWWACHAGLWLARHAERRHLAGLDDHMLRDIGITRQTAAREAERRFWRG